MYESSVIQHFAERGILQGIEQGERKRGIEDVVELLSIRFEAGRVEALKPNIEAVSDLQILRQLFRKAALANTLDEFKEAFDSIVENGS